MHFEQCEEHSQMPLLHSPGAFLLFSTKAEIFGSVLTEAMFKFLKTDKGYAMNAKFLKTAQL